MPDTGIPRDFRLQDFAGGELPRTGSVEDDLLPSRTYPSSLFWRMAKALDPQAGATRILDLGPTSNANIQFWAERGFDVSCCDVFTREARRIAAGDVTALTLSGDAIRDQRLPYESESFAAVCSWNLLSRLPFVLAQQYARECHRVLVPGGLLHAIFLDAEGRLETRRTYQIADRQQLRVSSVVVPRRLPASWIDAEIKLMLGRFSACEIQPAPAHTREVIAQRSPGLLTR